VKSVQKKQRIFYTTKAQRTQRFFFVNFVTFVVKLGSGLSGLGTCNLERCTVYVTTIFFKKAITIFMKHFGAAAKLALEVVHDPEARHKQLIVYINTSLPVAVGLMRTGGANGYRFRVG
jgi:hypothetical protein